MYHLAHSANLPEGRYIFCHVFSFYNGRLSNTCFSEANGPIFSKISGLVDAWKGLITWYITLRFLKGRCYGNQLIWGSLQTSKLTAFSIKALPRKHLAAGLIFSETQGRPIGLYVPSVTDATSRRCAQLQSVQLLSPISFESSFFSIIWRHLTPPICCISCCCLAGAAAPSSLVRADRPREPCDFYRATLC